MRWTNVFSFEQKEHKATFKHLPGHVSPMASWGGSYYRYPQLTTHSDTQVVCVLSLCICVCEKFVQSSQDVSVSLNQPCGITWFTRLTCYKHCWAQIYSKRWVQEKIQYRQVTVSHTPQRLVCDLWRQADSNICTNIPLFLCTVVIVLNHRTISTY